jgi:hypothetical protein
MEGLDRRPVGGRERDMRLARLPPVVTGPSQNDGPAEP